MGWGCFFPVEFISDVFILDVSIALSAAEPAAGKHDRGCHGTINETGRQVLTQNLC